MFHVKEKRSTTCCDVFLLKVGFPSIVHRQLLTTSESPTVQKIYSRIDFTLICKLIK